MFGTDELSNSNRCMFILLIHRRVTVQFRGHAVSVPLPSIKFGAKCSGTSLHSMGNISQILLSDLIVPGNKFTASLWAIPNRI